jgi:hypothetical protein
MLGSGFAPAFLNGAKDDGRGGGGDGDGEVAMMEHLLDRVLTPSDMGDLLMIPRQHIAKLTNVPVNSEQADFVVLEDRAVAGKLWRIDSYTISDRLGLTKGWGLGFFVKEKGLAAGDTVSFFRGAMDGRLFIDCRRRQPDVWTPRSVSADELHRGIFPWPPAAISYGGGHEGRVDMPGPVVNQATPESPQQQVPCLGLDEMPAHLLPRRRPRRNRVQPDEPVVMVENPTILESSPLVHSPEAKRVRLFGVYLN